MAPVTIIGHSLGGSIALLYAGLFPETVDKVVAIEGLGPSPEVLKRLREKTIEFRRALDAALQYDVATDPLERLAALKGPTGDIDQMLTEIGGGRC